MTWSSFIWFALPAMLLWGGAGTLIYKPAARRAAEWLMLLGIAVFAAFIVALWVGLERPPLRTMGETRLWYSFFLALVGYVTYKHWKYPWLLSFSALVAIVFGVINLLKPEIHSKSLMPALQSYWFVPHVTVYILSYAMLGAATIAALLQIRKLGRSVSDPKLFGLMDNLVYAGFGFLMLGMLMGCFWAKAAWGHYWSWDPKETWALITMIVYAVTTHLHFIPRLNTNPLVFDVMSVVGFSTVLMTFFGVNYYLSGLHSYGKSEGFSPEIVLAAGAGVLVLVAVAAVRYHKNKKTS